MTKQLLKGLIPHITTYPAIISDGINPVIIRRAQWGGIVGNETLTFEGADVLSDVTENINGTYSLEVTSEGLLEYVSTPIGGPARTRRAVISPIAARWAANAPVWWDFSAPSETYSYDRGSGPLTVVQSVPNKGYAGAVFNLTRKGPNVGDGPIVNTIGGQNQGVSTRRTGGSSGDTMTSANTPTLFGVRAFVLAMVINGDSRAYFSGPTSRFDVQQPMNLEIGSERLSFAQSPKSKWALYELVYYPPGTPNGGSKGAAGLSIDDGAEEILTLSATTMSESNTRVGTVLGGNDGKSSACHTKHIISLSYDADPQLISDTRTELARQRDVINGSLGL